jgi:hypothetical protein
MTISKRTLANKEEVLVVEETHFSLLDFPGLSFYILAMVCLFSSFVSLGFLIAAVFFGSMSFLSIYANMREANSVPTHANILNVLEFSDELEVVIGNETIENILAAKTRADFHRLLNSESDKINKYYINKLSSCVN